jgi:hypothetical protein
MMLNSITLSSLLNSCWTFKEPTPSYCGTIAVNSNCLGDSFPISWNTNTEWNNQLLVCTFGSPINGSCLSYDAQTDLPVITVPEFPGLFETTGNCVLSSGSQCDSHCENYIPLYKIR